MGKDQRPEIIDAEYTLVSPGRAVASAVKRPKKRPPETRHWTDAEYERWLSLPWWRRYGLNWPLAVTSGLIALAAAIRSLLN